MSGAITSERKRSRAKIRSSLPSRSRSVGKLGGAKGAATAAVVAYVLGARASRAVDPFEIQVYDGTANAPGVPGLELHMNTVAAGLTTSPSPPDYPQNHQSHLTLEPSIGLFPWWELGGYVEAALRGEEGAFDYAGVKLRNKFITPPHWDTRWRLGLNVEVSLLPQGYDRSRWGNELRPIVAWESDLFAFAFNPILDTSLAGPDASAGPTFQPCVSAVHKVHETFSFGFEYYADLGPFRGGFLPVREQEHYLYEVFNLLGVKHYELNAGVGEGLTAGSNPLVFKVIVGYVWERADASRTIGLPRPRAW